MLQMPLHLTRSSRLWTFQLLGFEMFQGRLQKSNHFYRDTQRGDFRPLEDEKYLCKYKYKDIRTKPEKYLNYYKNHNLHLLHKLVVYPPQSND
jgi:hypothetical protein